MAEALRRKLERAEVVRTMGGVAGANGCDCYFCAMFSPCCEPVCGDCSCCPARPMVGHDAEPSAAAPESPGDRLPVRLAVPKGDAGDAL